MKKKLHGLIEQLGHIWQNWKEWRVQLSENLAKSISSRCARILTVLGRTSLLRHAQLRSGRENKCLLSIDYEYWLNQWWYSKASFRFLQSTMWKDNLCVFTIIPGSLPVQNIYNIAGIPMRRQSATELVTDIIRVLQPDMLGILECR